VSPTEPFFGSASTEPGEGPGWSRLADALAGALPAGELDGLWCFSPIRRAHDEWGTAVLSRVEGDRRRIYTARYTHTIKGRERGKFTWDLREVGSGPLDALEELLALVPRRSDEEAPPVAVPLEHWFAPAEPVPDHDAADPE
jgi:hypothetical protein